MVFFFFRESSVPRNFSSDRLHDDVTMLQLTERLTFATNIRVSPTTNSTAPPEGFEIHHFLFCEGSLVRDTNLHYKDCSEMHSGSCNQMTSSCKCTISNPIHWHIRNTPTLALPPTLPRTPNPTPTPTPNPNPNPTPTPTPTPTQACSVTYRRKHVPRKRWYTGFQGRRSKAVDCPLLYVLSYILHSNRISFRNHSL